MVWLGLAVFAVPLLAVLGFLNGRRTQVRLDELTDTVAVLEKRVVALSAMVKGHGTAPEEPRPVRTPSRAVARPAAIPTASASVRESAPASEVAEESGLETSQFNWERLLGIRGAAWIGGIALVVAAVFFARWTIEHGFFTPVNRVACLILGGVGALVWAEVRRREGFHATAGPVSAAGIVMLYVAFFAGHNLYQLFEVVPAFIGMSAVTAVAAVVAIRYSSMFNAILGVVGGLATPLVLSTGTTRPEGLFLYLILLNAGYLFVSNRQRWQILAPLLLAGTSGIQAAWYGGIASPATLATTLVLFATLAGVYALHALSVDPAEQPRAFVATEIGSVVPLVYGIAALGFEGRWPSAFVYLAVLDALVIVVAGRRERQWPIVAAAILTAVALLVEATDHPTDLDTRLALAMIAFALAFNFIEPIAKRLWAAWLAEQGALLAAAGLVVTSGLFAATLASLSGTIDPSRLIAPWFLFAWLAMDTALVFVVVRRTGWTLLVPAAAAGALVFCLSWQTLRFDRGHAVVPAMAYLACYAFYLTLPFGTMRFVGSWRDRDASWVTSALIGPAFFLILRDAWLQVLGDAWIGFLPLTQAAVSALALQQVRWQFVASDRLEEQRRLNYLALFATIALGFVALAIPLQVGHQWITVSWAVEAAAVWWLFERLPHPALKGFGSVLFAIVGVRLLVNLEVLRYEPRGLPIFNWLLYTYGIPVLCCLAGAYALRRVEGRRLAPAAVLLALVLTFWLINLEIADAYSAGRFIELDFSRHLERDLVRSLAWGVYAVALLGLGIWRATPRLRLVSLVFLSLTVGKVFLYDLAMLTGLYRVLSFLALGLALIMVSMIYQRYVPRGDKAVTAA
jgi:uncharacterized membrane protein